MTKTGDTRGIHRLSGAAAALLSVCAALCHAADPPPPFNSGPTVSPAPDSAAATPGTVPAAPPAVLASIITPDTPTAVVTVKDPGLDNIPAATIRIPQGWHIEAAVVPGAAPVIFRAYSSDGLSELRLEPGYLWQYPQPDTRKARSTPETHSYAREERWQQASGFASDYAIAVNHAQVIGPMAVGERFQQRWQDVSKTFDQKASADSRLPTRNSYSIAALRTERVNGAFTIEQRVRVRVMCTQPARPAGEYTVTCSSVVDVLRAPRDQFDVLVSYMDAQGLPEVRFDPGWAARKLSQQTQPQLQTWPGAREPPLGQRLLRYQRLIETGPADFDRRCMTTQYMSASLLARQYASLFDWTDYALALIESDTRGTPAQFTLYNWSRPDGQQFRTANAGANPIGIIEGTWTVKPEPVVVHGPDCEPSGPQ